MEDFFSRKGGAMLKVVEQMDVQSDIWAHHQPMKDWEPNDEQLPLYVLTGRLKYIPPPMNKVVKIFLSSTFTDMYVERNYLFTNVYPKLQKYCRNVRNLEFQVVDMRWGVRDEASLDHSGPRTCMEELRSCQELSLGPNFVCLLGQRYGNRPLQAEIDKVEFTIIMESLNALGKAESIALLNSWYKCDENGLPPAMILMPLNEHDPEVTPTEFNEISPKLHDALRIGAQKSIGDGKMTEVVAQKYFWSVTEEEVYKGILSQPNAKDHTLCFVRNLVNINYSHKKAFRFVEMKEGVSEVNKETTQLIEKLVKETNEYLGAENCKIYEDIQWSDHGGTNEDSLAEYLEEFGKDFENKVTMLIDRAAEKGNPLQDSKLLIEIAEHDYQAIAKNKTFQGRDDIMDKIKEYIMSMSQKPYIMYGESGFGKTSLLAVASIRVYDWCGDTGDLVVVRRFLGTTPDSTNVGSLLHSVTKQISEACGFKPPHTEDAMQMLLFTLISVPSHLRVVIFLDSLDQLSAYGKAHTLAWLPSFIPSPNVKLIVSTLPNDHSLLDLLRMRRYSDRQFVEVNILETELSMKLMEDWLRSSSRQLSEPQLEVVKDRFMADANTSPLYIKLIFDVILKMRSYMDIEILRELLAKINSPVKCIRYIYEELMRKNGNLLVHRLFAYLHLSNLGLTENELVDLISLDDEVLNDVFQYHVPPLRRLPAVLWARIRNTIQEYIVTREANGGKVIAWYHRQFVEVGDTMYKDEFPTNYEKPEGVTDPATLCDRLRENMVNYFTGVWAGKGTKKPFQYTEKLRKKMGLTSADAEAERFVPTMPNILDNSRPNLRKLGQLPALLIKMGRIEEFFTEVFGNIEGLVGLFSMYSWSDIYEIADGIDFDTYKAIGKDKDEEVDKSEIKYPFQIIIRSFLLTSAMACVYPKMLGPLVLGRLLPFAAGSKILNDFINGVYEKGPKMNSFVCPHVQLEGVGTYLIFEMPNDHVGSCVAMIEVTPKDHHYILTLSKKAVLINMEDGNIQMRYMPPDLRKDDSFHLVAAANAFDDPEEIVASLKVLPKIYIFSLSQFDVGEIIDCRQIAGYEDMRIEALHMSKIANDTITAILAHGNAHDGLLVFDVKSQSLLYKFQNNRTILFITVVEEGLLITQPRKQIAVEISNEPRRGTPTPAAGKSDDAGFVSEVSGEPDDDSDSDTSSGPAIQQQSNTAPGDGPETYQFEVVAEYGLSLPGDSIITARTSKSNRAAFATEDGHVYYGYCGVPPKWTRMLLDSVAHDVEFFVKKDESAGPVIFTACTKHYAYILLVVDESDTQDIHEIAEDNLGLILHVMAKIKLSLTKLTMVDDSIAIGYHLGQVYVLKCEQISESIAWDIRIHRKFDAHSRPITGVIVNEDIATMLLSSAEDGSVRVFAAGLNVHPYLQESNTFDRMKVSVDKISATRLRSASLSQESSSVSVWENATAKITSCLDHSLQDDEQLSDVVCFDDRVVTITTNGFICFWDISQSPAELIDQVEVQMFNKMTRGCLPYEVLIKCTTSWHKFDAKTGKLTSEQVYENITILKHHYINGQLSLLQKLNEEEELLVEIIEEGESVRINLSRDKALNCGKLQDFFCCENFLALVYPRECVFYNWKQQQVLREEKVNKPVLIPSLSNTLLLRSGCSLQAFQIKKGVERFEKSIKLQTKEDKVVLTPDGNHVIIIEQCKMLSMYRVSDLSVIIGQYSTYGEVERVAFADDSSYIIMGIADTRLFYLMLCDVQIPGHHERVLQLQRSEYTEKEKQRGRILVEAAGDEQDDSDDEGVAEGTPQNINELKSHIVETYLKKAEALSITRNLDKGYSGLKALRSARRQPKKVADGN